MPRIAVFGTGSIGLRHLRIFSSIPGVDVYAVPLRLERVDELKAEGYNTTTRLEDLLPLDGVVVATNTGRHLSDSKFALRGSNFVLVEKPLAPSAIGIADFLAETQSRKKGVFVGSCLRFSPGLLAFRQHLAEVGSVYAVEISCRSYLPDWRPGHDYRTGYAANPQEGGVLRDLIHEIDYALWLYGDTERVFSHLDYSGLLGIETEEQATVIYKSKSAIQVCIQLDYLARTPVRRMSAFGSEGQICVDLINQTIAIIIPGAPPRSIDLEYSRDDMYISQAKAFLKAIEGQDPGQLSTGFEGLKALAVCDAARRSNQSEAVEEVKL